MRHTDLFHRIKASHEYILQLTQANQSTTKISTYSDRHAEAVHPQKWIKQNEGDALPTNLLRQPPTTECIALGLVTLDCIAVWWSKQPAWSPHHPAADVRGNNCGLRFSGTITFHSLMLLHKFRFWLGNAPPHRISVETNRTSKNCCSLMLQILDCIILVPRFHISWFSNKR